MIKNILWDFDGVILDSMKIKGDGFLELFKDYNQSKVRLLEEYHYKHGGVSRFEKIRFFFNHLLNKEIEEEEIEQFAKQFAFIISKKMYNKKNLIDETVIFIKENFRKYNFHIVSGSEHNELNQLCRFFKLDRYFISINGSPTQKNILVQNVLENYNYQKNETILIGDALTDFNAATINEIEFYGYNNLELNKYKYISTFKGLYL